METTLIETAEAVRRARLLEINAATAERPALEARHGLVWNAAELAADFEVLGFMAPLAVVRRKADNQLGSLLFQHHPRYYFAFQAHL
jgi:hypothetical protein